MKYQAYNLDDLIKESHEDLISEKYSESLPLEVAKRKAEVRKLIELKLDAKRLRQEMGDFDEGSFWEEEEDFD